MRVPEVTAPPQTELLEALSRLVGADRVASAGPTDAVDGVQPLLVAEPHTITEAGSILAWANQTGLRVVPRGGSSKIDWGNVPDTAELVVSTRRLDELVEHAAGDMTVTAQAGLTLGGLQQTLAAGDQMLALDPPFADQATLGGLIATNDSGPLRLRFGGVRDQLLGLTVVRADGVIIRGGGKVVKNVAGYDLPKLFTGSLGTLGLIVQATFRVYPCPAETRTLSITGATMQDAGALVLTMLDSTLVPTGLAVRWSSGQGCDVFLRFSGVEASVAAQVHRARGLIAERQLEPQELGSQEAAAVWEALGAAIRERGPATVVGRISVLPGELAPALQHLEHVAATAGLRAAAVVQGYGLGVIRLVGADESALEVLAEAVDQLRARLAARDGTLVLLSVPLAVKRRLDVWALAADTLPLMRRIKSQLDPNGTLNPGRLLDGV